LPLFLALYKLLFQIHLTWKALGPGDWIGLNGLGLGLGLGSDLTDEYC
jgi:hypothetical protein